MSIAVLHQTVNVLATSLSKHREVYSGSVADEKLVRLHNLKAVLKGRHVADRDRARYLMEVAGNSISFWSGLLGGSRSFGEKVARSIEEKLGLGRGHLDGAIDSGSAVLTPAPPPSWPLRRITPKQWDELDVYDRAAAEEAAIAKLKELHTERGQLGGASTDHLGHNQQKRRKS